MYTSSADIEFSESEEPESYECEPEVTSTLEIREKQVKDPLPEPPPFDPRAPVLLPGQIPHPNAARASEFMRQYFKMSDENQK